MSGAPFDTFLSVGGLTMRIVSDDRELAAPPGGALAAFAVGAGDPEIELRARWIDQLPGIDGRLLFESGGAWMLRQSDEDDDLVFIIRSPDAAPFMIARLDAALANGEVALHRPYFAARPASVAHPLQYPLDELVMIHLLSQGRGVEVHACGLLDSAGRAHLFAGQSGAGKSTMARLWMGRPDVTLLSDERIVLRTDGPNIFAYGTPWQGDAHFASPSSGELAAVYFLRHAAAHAIAAVPPGRAAARLLSCAFLPFHTTGAVERTLAAVEEVTQRAACYDLSFAPAPSVVDFVAERMQ